MGCDYPYTTRQLTLTLTLALALTAFTLTDLRSVTLNRNLCGNRNYAVQQVTWNCKEVSDFLRLWGR